MLGAEVLFIMRKIKSFILKSIDKIAEDEIVLNCVIDNFEKNYKITLGEIGVDLPSELEFMLRANDISLSKKLLEIIQFYKKGQAVSLPNLVFSESQIQAV